MTDQRSQVASLLRSAGDTVTQALNAVDRMGLPREQVEMLEQWAGDLRISRGLSPATTRNYIDAVSRLLFWLNASEIELAAVTPADIEDWHRDLYLEHKEGVKTRSLRLSAVRQFFAWRERNGAGTSPARSVPGPRRERRAAKKYSRVQIQRMLQSCDRTTKMGRRDYSILLFLLSTGARRMEVSALRLDQIEMSDRVGVVRLEGKGSKERVISFEGPTVAALREWLAERDGLDVIDRQAVWIGLSGRGKGKALRDGGLRGVIRRALGAAKLKIEPRMGLHRFRVTFATMLYDEVGYDLRVIQRLMGHEDIETTLQYIAVSDTVQKARMPGSVVAKLTGDHGYDAPLWLKQKRKNRRNGQQSMF